MNRRREVREVPDFPNPQNIFGNQGDIYSRGSGFSASPSETSAIKLRDAGLARATGNVPLSIMSNPSIQTFNPFNSPYSALLDPLGEKSSMSSGGNLYVPESKRDYAAPFQGLEGGERIKVGIPIAGGENFGLGNYLDAFNSVLKTNDLDKIQDFSTTWQRNFQQAAQQLADSFANEEFAASAKRQGTSFEDQQRNLLDAYNYTADRLARFGLI